MFDIPVPFERTTVWSGAVLVIVPPDTEIPVPPVNSPRIYEIDEAPRARVEV